MSSGDNIKFRKLLKKATIKAGNQTKIANELGVSNATISYWLHGICVPSAKMAMKLQKLYGIKVEISRPDIFDLEQDIVYAN